MCTTLEKLYNKTAEEVLAPYENSNGFLVDISRIAHEYGIKTYSLDFMPLETSDVFKEMVRQKGHIYGAIRVKDDDVCILYHNALHDLHKFKNLTQDEQDEKLIRRQRFTIAHELAHCCLHMEPSTAKNHVEFRTELASYTDEMEQEANIFAGKLLIPLEKLEIVLKLFRDNVSISFLSDVFRVSKHVMEARIKYLKFTGELSGLITITDG